MLNKVSARLKIVFRVLLHGDEMKLSGGNTPKLTPDEILEVKNFFPMPKFFIFGHARSGTTLLARLIRLHPDIHCNWQAHFFTREPTLYSLVADPKVKEWMSARSNRWNMGRDLSALVMRVSSDFILEREARCLGKSVVGDKSPNNQLKGKSVSLLHGIYPDAKLIFIVRDGRDTVLSHRFQGFIDFPNRLKKRDLQIRENFIDAPESFLKENQSIFSPGQLMNEMEKWVENLEETDSLANDLFGSAYLRLHYEDLLSDPVSTLEKIWSFLGFSEIEPKLKETVLFEMTRNPDEEWQKEQANEMRINIQKGKSGSWKDFFSDQDRLLTKQIAGETLIKWGYEKDLEW
jgi:LPS sulfotransferase NodH